VGLRVGLSGGGAEPAARAASALRIDPIGGATARGSGYHTGSGFGAGVAPEAPEPNACPAALT